MRKILIGSAAAAAMLLASFGAAAPASAGSLQKFCWNHPYAPVCWDFQHHHHHHHHWWPY